MTMRAACLLIGYALGCIQTAYIIGRITARIDIREHGSGNAGTSNVIRVIGRSAGVIVFLIDVLKAVAAYTVASLLFGGGGTFISGASVLPGLYAGLGVVLGHNFPFFLKFKGGKGIAATLGLMLSLDIRTALMVYAVGALILALTRYISLASLVMTLLFAVLLGLFSFGAEAVTIAALLAVMAWVLHRENIKRLLAGTERKFTWKRKRGDT